MNRSSLPGSEKVVTENESSSAPVPLIASRENIPLLDALRGLCALGVLVSHIHTPGIPRKSGAIFVDIFMVISGFLMTHHYILREQKEPWDRVATAQKFYLRRFFRIAPLYYFCLIYFFLFYGEEVAHDQNIPMGWNMVQHFTFLFGFLQSPGGTGMPDWSLALEMQFYLVFPILMLWIMRSGPVPLLLMAAFISWIANRLFGVYDTDLPGLLGLYNQPSFLPLKFTLFTFGILAAFFYWKRIELAWPFTGLLTIASMAPYKHGHSWTVLGVLGFALMIAEMTATRNFVRSVLLKVSDFCRNRIFHYLAEYSYAVYLIHGFVFARVIELFGNFLLDRSPWLHWFFVLTMTTLIVYPVAFLLQHFIEKPGIALGRRLCSGSPKRLLHTA